MLTVLLIIVLFALIVIIHEWGHYVAARRSGVDVEEFGIGFPPRLWGKKVGATFYSFNLIPLGGFVRLKGEDSTDRGPHTFGAAKFTNKAKILLAGVVFNLITAVVLFYALAVTGMPGLGSGFEPSFVKAEYAQPKQLILAQVTKDSPAWVAGLREGDFLLTANGKKIETDDKLFEFTKGNAGKEVVLLVSSDGDEREVRVTLRDPSNKEGFLGVSGQQVYKLKYDPVSAIAVAFYVTGALFVATVAGVVKLLASVPLLLWGLFGGDMPEAAKTVAGPIGIVFMLTNISALGFAYIFLFMANIAVALAAFNVLPLPALDGGRLALIAWSKALKKKIDPLTESKIHAYGFMALIGLMIVISVYDIRKIF